MTQDKKNVTLIVGLSNKPDRYAFRAAKMLLERGHSVIAFGLKNEKVLSLQVYTHLEDLPEVPHTITLYVNPQRQKDMIPHLLKLKPQRIIFNPGTENPEFQERAQIEGIHTENACTLVLLSTGTY